MFLTHCPLRLFLEIMLSGDVVKTVLEIKSAKMSKHITVNNGFFVLKMDLLYIKTTTK
jgi:hypothetical protein